MKKYLYISFGLIILATAITFFIFYEVLQSRDSLLNLMKSESKNLIQSLKLGIENNIKSNELLDDAFLGQLYSSATLAAHTEKELQFSEYSMSSFNKEFNIDFIGFYNFDGSIQSCPAITGSKLSQELTKELDLILKGKYYWLELGEYSIGGKFYYLLARERFTKKGIVITGISSDRLLNLRKDIGIGNLINQFSKNENIDYIVMQDTLGIIAASKNVKEFPLINKDTFLLDIENKTKSHVIDYKGKKILETVAIIDNYASKPLLRIGLSLEKLRMINQANMMRSIFLGLGIFLIAAFIIIYLVMRERLFKLKESHTRMIEYSNILLHNIHDCVIAINTNKEIILLNTAAENIFDIDKNSNLNYDKQFQNDELYLNKTLHINKNIDFEEIEYKNKSGRKFDLALSTSILFNSKGEIDTVLAIAKDLTELKNIQQIEQRKEKLSAMGQLAAGVAHEIRNPLNAINVIAQRFEYEFIPDNDKEEYKKLVTTVRNEVKRVNKIIEQFLEFAKPAKLNLITTDINEIIDKAVNLIESSANQKKIKIIKELTRSINLKIDADKIEQVFINLLLNAIDAIGENGIIDIKSLIENDKLVIKIRDSGKGIPLEIKSKIFNLYFTTKTKGSGLGLSIVNQIITEHGGKLTFESEVENGTEFIIDLPIN